MLPLTRRKTREFANARYVLNFKVCCPAEVAADVGQHRKCTGRNHGAANRETVQTIGEIHGVGTAGDHEGDEQKKWQERESASRRPA